MGRNPLPLVIAIAALLFFAAAGGKPKAQNAQPVAVATPAPVAVESAIELMDFGGDWCGPCREMKPAVKQLESQGLRVHRVDPHKDQATADKWNVTACPCFIAVRDGKEVDRITGVTSLENLRALVAGKAKSQSATNDATPSPAQPALATGPEGWRLRLFYPRGSTRGETIRSQLTAMKAIAAKYGFDASTTDEPLFKPWRKQLSANDVTLVLIHPDDRIVYQATAESIPTDAIVLREKLRESARNSWKESK